MKRKRQNAKSPRKSADKESPSANRSAKAPVKETYQQYIAKLRSDRRRIEKLMYEYYRDDSKKRTLESAKRIRKFEKKSSKR